jgi:PAS domain S-box-containing protein
MEYVVRCIPDGTIRFVNETYCLAAGKTKEDLVNRPFRPLVSPEDAQRIQGHLMALTPENPTGVIEFRAIMAGGEIRWQRWKNRALFNDRGELTGYQSCGLDITELMEIKGDLAMTKDRMNETLIKRTDELRATNRQLYAEISLRDKFEQHLLRSQYVMDHSVDSILLANKNGHIRYTNRRAEEVLGFATDELTDIPLSVIVPKLYQDPFDGFLNEVRKNGEIRADTYLVSKSSTKIPVEILVKYIMYQGDDLICCFARSQPANMGVQDELSSRATESMPARKTM